MSAFFHDSVRALPYESSEIVHAYIRAVACSKLVFVWARRLNVGQASYWCLKCILLISHKRSSVLFQLSIKAIFRFWWRIFFLSLDCLFSQRSRVWSGLSWTAYVELLQVLIVAVCLVEVSFSLTFSANNADRVFVPHYCLNVVDNSHIVAIWTTIYVVVCVLLSLELVSLNELSLGLNPVLPCPCPGRDSALFIIQFNHPTDNIIFT